METRFELRIYRDRMILLDHRSGEQLDRKSPEPFSSRRLLVADTNIAGDLLGAMIREMLSSRFMSWPTVTLVSMELCDDGLSMVELLTLGKLARDAGFRKAFVKEGGSPPFALS